MPGRAGVPLICRHGWDVKPVDSALFCLSPLQLKRSAADELLRLSCQVHTLGSIRTIAGGLALRFCARGTAGPSLLLLLHALVVLILPISQANTSCSALLHCCLRQIQKRIVILMPMLMLIPVAINDTRTTQPKPPQAAGAPISHTTWFW